jgi:hypothetical protein
VRAYLLRNARNGLRNPATRTGQNRSRLVVLPRRSECRRIDRLSRRAMMDASRITGTTGTSTCMNARNIGQRSFVVLSAAPSPSMRGCDRSHNGTVTHDRYDLLPCSIHRRSTQLNDMPSFRAQRLRGSLSKEASKQRGPQVGKPFFPSRSNSLPVTTSEEIHLHRGAECNRKATLCHHV